MIPNTISSHAADTHQIQPTYFPEVTYAQKSATIEMTPLPISIMLCQKSFHLLIHSLCIELILLNQSSSRT